MMVLDCSQDDAVGVQRILNYVIDFSREMRKH